jgi:hypothetical protein
VSTLLLPCFPASGAALPPCTPAPRLLPNLQRQPASIPSLVLCRLCRRGLSPPPNARGRVGLPYATVGLDKVRRRPSLLLPINARAPELPGPPHRREGATAPPLLPMAPAPPAPSHRREGTGATWSSPSTRGSNATALAPPPPTRGRHSVPFQFLQREDAAPAPASPPPRRARRATHSPSTPTRGRLSVPSHFLQREDAAPLLLLPHRV